MMHILFASQRYFGIRQSRLNLIRALVARGHSVTLVTNFEGADPQTEIPAKGFTAIEAPFSIGRMIPANDLKAAWVLGREIRRRKPAIVHLFNAKPVLLGGAMMRTFHRRRPPRLVATITGLGYGFSANRGLGQLAGTLYSYSAARIDQHIFQNESDLDLFLSRGWADPARVLKVPGSGVDLKRFARRARVGGGQPLRLLFAGRFLRSKGIGDFLEMARRARAEGLEAEFLVVGEHVDHPDAFPLAEIEAASADGLVTNLGFVQDMPDLLSRTDILVLPTSYAEGLPRVLLEAGAMGVPALAYANPGVEEFVTDGDNGFVVPAHDTAAATARIARMIAEPGLAYRLGSRARQRVETEFDMNRIDTTHIELYERLVGEIS